MDTIVDKPEPAPEGTTDERSGAVDDYANLSFEELEAKVNKPEEPKATTPVVEKTPPEASVDSDLPPELRNKSPKDLANMYLNLRDMQSKQANELGELRKFKQQQEEAQLQMKQLQIESVAKRIVAQEQELSPEEAALAPTVMNIIGPLLREQARVINESEIRRLKEHTKNSLVPYSEAEVNQVIASFNRDGKNELFDQLGSGAFEYAYNIYFQQNINSAIERKLRDITDQASAEADKEAAKKAKAYSEPGSPSPPGEPLDYASMSFEELEKYVKRLK